jgi:Spy/CpxP family protein refolding chaperone
MMGPVPMARLATDEKVQEALKVNDKQKDEIKSLNDEVREEVTKLIGSGGPPDREKMKEIMDTASEKLNKVIDADQQKRLMGVFVQVNGARSLMDPAVEKELSLTGDQKDKIHELLGPPGGGRGEGRGRGEGKGEGKGEAKGEGRGERGGAGFREQREKAEKEVMAVLTPDQQKKLEDLKGEKVEVDMAKLRPGGGRGGRDRGNRGEPKESKSS